MIKLVGLSISGIPANLCPVSGEATLRGLILRTWATLRTEVSKDNHRFFALLDGATLNGSCELIFAVERSCLASEAETLFPCDLCNGPARRQIAFQNPMVWLMVSRFPYWLHVPEMSRLFDRLMQRSDNVLISE
jgi:hypothetical protein